MTERADFAIKFDGFSFSYPESPDEQPLLGPLSWEVPSGSFCVLVGQTGSGKTTLLKNLVPALAPAGTRSGSIRLFGTPLEEIDPLAAATTVGYVAQNPDAQLVCDTVWHELAFGLENLGMPQDAMRLRVAEVAHFFGMEPWFRCRVADLSGGRKQITALAAALALRPSMLLLDEPTSQLDPIAERVFLHELFRVNRQLGITIVVATHAPESLVDYATHAACMRAGRVESCELATFRVRPLDLSLLGEKNPAREGSPSPSSALPSSVAPRLHRRLFRASSSDEAAAQETGTPEPAIVLKDAYMRYRPEDDWVLRGFDLAVKQGSVHALIGGNGCGKSTLLRVIAQTSPLERGGVRNRLATRQALLPQNPKALLVCDSVAEELAEWQASCAYSDDEIAHIAQTFGLSKLMDAHPFDLSGGQQQLLALAKLLLTKPDLLLLDEPTKGLDPEAKLLTACHISAFAHGGGTVVAATHDLAFAALACDTVTLLFDGENAATQTPEAFFDDNLFYRPSRDRFADLWASQMGERHA